MTTDIYTSFQFEETGLSIRRDQSPFSITLSHEQLQFKDSNSIVAWIDRQEMYINKLKAEIHLIVGVHKIRRYDLNNNEITLVEWVGESS